MNNEPPKRRRGCLFYGCITGIICLVAILLALLLGLHQFKKVLSQYTDTRPMPLPAAQMDPAQASQVQRRVESFQEALRGGHAASALVLTADDIDALIATSPDFQAMKGKVYVTINESQVKAQVSVPMDQIGLPLFKGHYLNGTGTFAVSLQNGTLLVALQEMTVKGKPLPAIYLDKLRNQNLAAGFNSNPNASAVLNRLEDIRISDGKLTLVPKQQP
jgi:hypothetical protein